MLVRLRHSYSTFKRLKTPALGSHWFESFQRTGEIDGLVKSMTYLRVERKSKTRRLPPELLELIFSRCDQPGLSAISQCSKSFNSIAVTLLYKSPKIGTIESLNKFLRTILDQNEQTWPYKSIVQSIYFLPTSQGSLQGFSMTTASTSINQVHSSLFRLFVYDREMEICSGHPLLAVLLSSCPSLVSIREGDHTSNPQTWAMSDYNLVSDSLTDRRRFCCQQTV